VSKRRLVITAVLAGRSQSEVARTYGVSQGWISRLMARYRESGDAAFDPLSRAPKTTPGATDRASVQLVVELRSKLARAWLDAGAGTIGWHLHHHHKITLSRATINRILVRAGLATRPNDRLRGPGEPPRMAAIPCCHRIPQPCGPLDSLAAERNVRPARAPPLGCHPGGITTWPVVISRVATTPASSPADSSSTAIKAPVSRCRTAPLVLHLPGVQVADEDAQGGGYGAQVWNVCAAVQGGNEAAEVFVPGHRWRGPGRRHGHAPARHVRHQ
jgi:transposase